MYIYISGDEMKNRIVTEKIRKIIAILHVIDKKPVWNLQCILDGLSLLNVHIDDEDGTILKFEKHSLLDLVKSAPIMAFPEKSKKETSENKPNKKTSKKKQTKKRD